MRASLAFGAPSTFKCAANAIAKASAKVAFFRVLLCDTLLTLATAEMRSANLREKSSGKSGRKLAAFELFAVPIIQYFDCLLCLRCFEESANSLIAKVASLCVCRWLVCLFVCFDKTKEAKPRILRSQTATRASKQIRSSGALSAALGLFVLTYASALHARAVKYQTKYQILKRATPTQVCRTSAAQIVLGSALVSVILKARFGFVSSLFELAFVRFGCSSTWRRVCFVSQATSKPVSDELASLVWKSAQLENVSYLNDSSSNSNSISNNFSNSISVFGLRSALRSALRSIRSSIRFVVRSQCAFCVRLNCLVFCAQVLCHAKTTRFRSALVARRLLLLACGAMQRSAHAHSASNKRDSQTQRKAAQAT